MKNLAEDDGAMFELERMGMMTTPVTVIGDEDGREEVIVGFDREKLGRLPGI